MSKIEFLVLAPTGIAANNINCQTIHSALSIVQHGIDGQFRSFLMASGFDKQQEIRKTSLLMKFLWLMLISLPLSQFSLHGCMEILVRLEIFMYFALVI